MMGIAPILFVYANDCTYLVTEGFKAAIFALKLKNKLEQQTDKQRGEKTWRCNTYLKGATSCYCLLYII